MTKSSGYIAVGINSDLELVPFQMIDAGGVSKFWVDFEDGRLFLKLDENREETIGYYVKAESISPDRYLVYDKDRTRVIGTVEGGLIYFAKYDQVRCLAYYNESGSITDSENILEYYGIIIGDGDKDVAAGAAAFVAFSYGMNVKSKFHLFYND